MRKFGGGLARCNSLCLAFVGAALAGCGTLPRSEALPEVAVVEGEPAGEILATDDTAPGALFGFLERMVGSPTTSPAQVASGEVSLPVVPAEDGRLGEGPMPEEAESRGLFGWMGLGGEAATPVSEASAVQGDLPYGELRTVCGLSSRNLGREVESASGYAVHDTAPGSTAPRTHYITGFSDGCARQFTAALALFGDIGTHEIVRYGTADGGLEYTETDHAYEEIKAAFCGVRAGRPCGARLERLARRTTFLTVYERFGSSPVWADILLHDGTVAAMDFKGDQ